MSPALTAMLAALIVWWISTGAILLLVRLSSRREAGAGRMLTLSGLPVLALGVTVMLVTRHDMSILGAYAGFLSAIAIWGWIELAFLTGTITGPVTRDLPRQRPAWDRFLRAWGTVAYHEMLLAAAMIFLLIVLRDAANSVGLWTFGILYAARLSAKLNLFFGVPHIALEFVPPRLAHLSSYFRIAPMNALFPFSITGLTLLAAYWLSLLFAAAAPADQAAAALLATLAALGLLEHWFLVLPLREARLWQWMLPTGLPDTKDLRTSEGHHEL